MKKLLPLLVLMLILSGCVGNSKTQSTKELKGGSLKAPTQNIQTATDSGIAGEPGQAPTPSAVVSSDSTTPKPTDSDKGPKDILIITEKMFLTQINDIYLNFEDYKDTTVQVEGIFAFFTSLDDEHKVPVVFRNGPGCCGNDSWGGFLLDYSGIFPKENDWIKVTGTPILVEDGQYTDLYLKVKTLEVLKTRGAETVTH